MPEINYTTATSGYAPERTPTGHRVAISVSRECPGEAQQWTSLGEHGERVPYSGKIYTKREAAVAAARRRWRH